MKDVNIYIYTEYNGNLRSGSGKYHVVLETMVKTKKGEEPATLKKMGSFEEITRNRLELVALDNALEHMTVRSRIIVHTASDYITGAFMNDWPWEWERNGYKRKGKPIKHAELWESIMEKVEKHDVTFMKSEKTSYTKAQATELKNFKGKENKEFRGVGR